VTDPIDHIIGAAILTFMATPFLYFKNKQRTMELEKFRTAFEFSPTPQFIKDHNFLVVAVNKAFTDAFGLTMNDYKGLNLHQQNALFSESPTIYFEETDKRCISSDEVIYTTESLIPPRPNKSIMPDPVLPHEFFISKQRFPIRHGIHGIEYGIIGSAKSMELVLIYAERARSKAEELQNKSRILQAIVGISTRMEKGFADIKQHLDKGEIRFQNIESIVDPDGTIKAKRDFGDFDETTKS
jgi:PAS domain-containing protein